MPLNEILPPTNISSTGTTFFFGLVLQQITTLTNGNYVVTYSDVEGSPNLGEELVWQIFTPTGVLVASGIIDNSFHDEEPVVTALSGGGFALAWFGFSPFGVFTAVYDAQGVQTVPPTLVSAAGDSPAIYALPNDAYALVWQDPHGTSFLDSFVAVYNAAGTQIVAPINITATPAFGEGDSPSFALLSNGNLAITWTRVVLGNDYDIFTAVYTAQGVQVTASHDVSNNPGNESEGSVQTAALTNGGYVLTWARDAVGGGLEIVTAICDAFGQQVGATALIGPGVASQVAALANGTYVLFWSNGVDVFTAVYDALGQQLSTPVNVSNGDAFLAYPSPITVLSNGAYALVWEGQPVGSVDGTTDIFTAVFDAQGQEVVAPLNVSNSAGIYDALADVTALANGAYAMSWESGAGGVLDVLTAVYQYVDTSNFTYDGIPDLTLDLSALIDLGGSLIVTNNGALVAIDLSNLFSVGGNFVLSNNGELLTITLPSLTNVGGSLDIIGNTSATAINLGSLGGVGGDLAITGNTSATAINLGSLGSVGGDLSLDNNTSAAAINLGSLGSVGGDLAINSNTSASAINLGSLGNVGGDLSLDNNTSAAAIDLGSLGGVAGDLSLDNNTSAAAIDLGSLGSVGGDLAINSNTSASAINLGSLGNVGGDLSLDSNTSSTAINLGSLGGVGGDLAINSNTSASAIDLGSLGSVGGDLAINSNTSASAINLGSLGSVGGDLSFDSNTSVITIDLSALIQAGAIVISDNGVITLNLSALVNAGGNVAITNNDNLLTVDMPNLATVDGSVSIQTSHTTIDLGGLDTVAGDVTIAAGPDAISVDASALGPGGGTVTMEGGSNDDTTIVIGALANMGGTLTITGAGGVTVTAQAGLAELTITGTAGGDTVTGSATATNIMDGGAGDDTLTAGAGDDQVSGGAGDDTMVGGHGGGDDTYDGGADIDTVTYTSTVLGVLVDLAAGTASGAEIGSDTLIGIENVIGGAGGDDISGDAGANVLDGLGGGDHIAGRGGNDTLAGGEGSDTAIYSGRRSDYTIQATGEPNTYQVTDNRAGANDGTDLVGGFEEFQFSDGTLAEADILTVTTLNDAPTVANAIADKNATEDSAFAFTVPSNTFADVDVGDSLTLTATLANGNPLPGWLTFNPATGAFTGTPLNADVGPITVRVSATDGSAATAFDDFVLTVASTNDAPTLANAIADKNATEDNAFAFTVPSNTFADVDVGDSLTLTATLANGNPLPGWLTFNPATGAFTGTPLNADVGPITVRVTATDGSAATAFDDFVLTVASTNDAPTLANAIADKNATEDSAFAFTVPSSTFADVDVGDSLTLTAALANGNPLPGWLAFNPATGAFTGTPLNADVGPITVRVTATDGSAATAFDDFVLTVASTNDAPTLANAIADKNATEDSAFAFTVPSSTFADVDVGDSLTLTAALANGNPLPGWLAFNPATGAFTGTPLNADVGPITVRVTATDGSAATAFDDFVLTVASTNDAPTANPDTGSAGENETKSFNVLANDADPDAGDSKTLVSIGTVAVSSSNAAVNAIIAASALSIVAGQIQFSPGTLFDPLNTGETATVVVDYTMRDAAGVTSSSALTLTINGAAEGPVFNVINGTPGNDHNLNGTAAADQINGLAGNDSIDAKGGDDLIIAGAGRDTVSAGGGNDTVMATINDGNDFYFGESGSDTFDFSQTGAAATVNLGTTIFGFTFDGIGYATSAQIGTDGLLSFENVIGGSGNDTITGDDLANSLRGGAGNDTISGLRGDDRLAGDAGNDRLVGGQGSDLMTGGLNADTFVFQAAQSHAGDIDTITDFVVGQDHLQLQGLSVTQLAQLDVNSDSVLDTSLTLSNGTLVQLEGVNGVSDWHLLL